MLKSLLKKQLTEIFRSYFYDAKKNTGPLQGWRRLRIIVLFVLLMVGVLGGMFTVLSVIPLHAAAPRRAGLAVFCADGAAGRASWARSAACSIPTAGLYLAKDNDLLLSHAHPGAQR